MTFFHYLSMPFVFGSIGVLWHLWRSLRLLPDRLLSPSQSSNFLESAYLPGGFGWTDWLYETDFDEDGHYLGSLRNLKITVLITIVTGSCLAILAPDIYVACVDWLASAIWARIKARIADPW